MRKKFTVITLIASLVLFNGVFTHETFAEKNSDLEGIQTERKALQQNLSSQEKKVNQLFSEMQSLDEEVTVLNQQVLQKQSEVEEITGQLDLTKTEIASLQVEIEKLNDSIDQRYEILKSRAASYQKAGGSINYLEVLFGSSSFGEFVSRLTAVNQIVDSDTALMKQLETDMNTVEEHRLTTMEKLDDLNEMQHEQETQLASLEEEKQKQEKAKESLSKKQEELIAYVEQLKSEDANLESLESKVKLEIQIAAKEQQEAEERQIAAAKKAEAEKTESESNLVHVSKVEEKRKTNSAPQTSSPSVKTETTVKTPKKTETETNKKSFDVSSTAYTASCSGCSGITSTGIDLNKNSSTKVIAVDPSVIPLGSLVHVEGYGYAIAGDTGGAIRGNKIDVFVPTKKEAMNWGVRTVKVTIQ